MAATACVGTGTTNIAATTARRSEMHGHHRRRELVREMQNGDRSTTRVQLEMPPQAMERLQRLKERTEAASYAEVIRSALRVFEALVAERDAGAEFSLKKPGGETVAYRIFL